MSTAAGTLSKDDILLANIVNWSVTTNYSDQFLAVSSTFVDRAKELLIALFSCIHDYILSIRSTVGYSDSNDDKSEVSKICHEDSFSLLSEPNDLNLLNSVTFSLFCFTKLKKKQIIL